MKVGYPLVVHREHVFDRAMPVERDLGGDLLARIDHSTLDIVFPGGASTIRFTRKDRLVQIALRFAVCRLGVDVSFQPGVVALDVDQAARQHAIDPNRWRLATGVCGAWCPRRGRSFAAGGECCTTASAALGPRNRPCPQPLGQLCSRCCDGAASRSTTVAAHLMGFS